MRFRQICMLVVGLALASGVAAAQGKPAGPPMGGPPGAPGGPGGPGGGAPPPPPPPPPSANRPAGSSSQAGNVGRFGPVGRWWDDKSIVRAVGLSNEQQKKMDLIFNANKPAILGAYKTFLSEKAKQDALSKQPNVDQAKMFEAIDAVSQAKASLEKANTAMLLQIRQQMQPEQVNKLENLK